MQGRRIDRFRCRRRRGEDVLSPRARRTLAAVCLAVAAIGAVIAGARDAAGQLTASIVILSYPPDRTLVTKADLVVEGHLLDPAVDEIEIAVNDGRPVRAPVRDTVFVEEISLDDGLNVIRIGPHVREVWLVSDGERPPPGFKEYFGHFGLDDGCLECHQLESAGKFTLAGEREEICAWCHGDILRGTRAAPFASTHAPVRSGRCLSCHDPHLSDKRGLPAAAPPTCESCHAAVVDRLKTDRFVHGPMSLGDCRLCHAVHGSTQPRLLLRPATALCTDCHSDVLAPPGTPKSLQPHPMIPEGQCGRCHEPHSSANALMLRQAAGRLCQDCHEGKTRSFHESKGFSIYICAKCHDLHRPSQPHLIIEASRSLCTECHDFTGEATFTHSFVAEGRCFNCHSFHEASLPREVAATCLACHRENPRLPAAHRGLAIEHARCTGCHRPHQAQHAMLLRSVEHTPFARRECSACHRETAGAPVDAASRRCVDCHREKDLDARAPAPANVHPPFQEQGCGDCHRSHNAEVAGLLHEPELRLCLGCHRSMRKATLLTPASAHTAVTEGRCGACHDPHFSENDALLRRPHAELCPSCHAGLTQTPDGGTWPVAHKPVAEGKCRLCHKAHTSSSPALLKAPSPQACRPCHIPFFSGVEARQNLSVHEPVSQGACGVCHQVHGGPSGLLVPGARRERCVSCHPKPQSAHHSIPQATIEAAAPAAAVSGCLYCHLPHSSRRPRLLAATEGPCKACHKL